MMDQSVHQVYQAKTDHVAKMVIKVKLGHLVNEVIREAWVDSFSQNTGLVFYFKLTLSKFAKIWILFYSQTEQVPSCPKGSIRLWDGFSMVANQIGNQIIPVDIGKLLKIFKIIIFHHDRLMCSFIGSSGSCVENFQVMPLMKAHSSRLSVNSYWLMSETNRQNDLESRIGRCTVCEVPANIINLHSQTDQV